MFPKNTDTWASLYPEESKPPEKGSGNLNPNMYSRLI